MALENLWQNRAQRLRARRHRHQPQQRRRHRQQLQHPSERVRSAAPSHHPMTREPQTQMMLKSRQLTEINSADVPHADAGSRPGISCTSTSANTNTNSEEVLQRALTSESAASPMAAMFPPPPAQFRASWVWGTPSHLSLLAMLKVWALRRLGPMRSCRPSLTMAGRRRRTRTRSTRLPPSRNP